VNGFLCVLQMNKHEPRVYSIKAFLWKPALDNIIQNEIRVILGAVIPAIPEIFFVNVGANNLPFLANKLCQYLGNRAGATSYIKAAHPFFYSCSQYGLTGHRFEERRLYLKPRDLIFKIPQDIVFPHYFAPLWNLKYLFS